MLVGVVFNLLKRICRFKKNLKKDFVQEKDIPNHKQLFHLYNAKKLLKLVLGEKRTNIERSNRCSNISTHVSTRPETSWPSSRQLGCDFEITRPPG